MIIDDRARRSVAYVVEEGDDNGEPVKWETGTCFFVGIAAEGPGYWLDIRYAVTARHVIEAVAPPNQLYVRLNLKSGGYSDVPTDMADWFCNPATDVAVYRMRDWRDDFDAQSLPVGWFWVGGDDAPPHNKLEVGDEVATVGLFAQHPGRSRNQPVVRFGRVSLMPHEQIKVQITKCKPLLSIDVFVIEATSWGGQSGSPVFLYWPHHREWQMPDKGDRGPWLLGLVHGNFRVLEDLDMPESIPGDWFVRANAGLTMVVTANDIFHTIYWPSVVSDREQVLADAVGKFLNGISQAP